MMALLPVECPTLAPYCILKTEYARKISDFDHTYISFRLTPGGRIFRFPLSILLFTNGRDTDICIQPRAEMSLVMDASQPSSYDISFGIQFLENWYFAYNVSSQRMAMAEKSFRSSCKFPSLWYICAHCLDNSSLSQCIVPTKIPSVSSMILDVYQNHLTMLYLEFG
jgi:hypothetical protein